MMTLEEIGKNLNLTKERIRQIEKNALMKLRKSKKIEVLADYMQNPDKALENLEVLKETKKETKEKQTKPKLKTIYQYFSNYSKEQVDEMIEKLTEEEKALMEARYGKDLNNIEKTKLTRQQTNRFYGSLVPKMRRLLENSNQSRKKQMEEKQESTTKEKNESTLEQLRIPTFNQMISTLTVKEAVIISLKLGYVDNKYFKIEEIAQFLGIEKQEVIDTTKKALLRYKENINQLIDHTVEIVTDQKEQLIKKR